MSDTSFTTETVEILPGLPKVPFNFYEGEASNIPVADIGLVLAALIKADDYQVVGETNDAYSVFLRGKGANTIGFSFTMMSFGDPPAEGPPMQRAQFNRFHLTVMNFVNLRQLTLPFFVPSELAYMHDKAIWGTKYDAQPAWTGPKEEVFSLIGQLVEPVVHWLNMVRPESQ